MVPKKISFSQGIPLDSVYLMDEFVVDQGLAFYPTGKRVAGGSCYLRLIATGSISPNFWGMARDIQSLEFEVGEGAVNLVYFWFDGTQVRYRITQSATIVNGPEEVLGATVQHSGGAVIEVNFDKNLSYFPIPDLSCFSVKYLDGTIKINEVAVNEDTTNQLLIFLDKPIDYETTCFVTYTQPLENPLTTTQGYTVASFTDVGATRPD